MTKPESPTDEDLMERYASGDAAAFEALFERHRGRLFRFLLHSTNDESAAEDLFQEVFVKIVRARENFTRSGSFKSWLYAIARNALVDRHRRRGVRPDQSVESRELDEGKHGRSAASSPEVHLLRRRIREAVASIPREQREVFLLREQAGMDFQQIANIVGCGVPTAKSRMRYALERLRRLLTDERLKEGGYAIDG